MTSTARYLLLGLLFLMGLNHLVMGLFWLPTYSHTGPVLLAFALYALALTFSIYGHQDLKLPASQAYLNLAIAVVVPVLVLIELPVASVQEGGSYQTWFVGAISWVLSISSARGYPWIGWVGTAWLWLVVIIWGGAAVITTSGLIGALIMVATAWAMGRGLRGTEAAAQEYHRQAADVQARVARTRAARDERHRLVQASLTRVAPMLERIVAQNGALADHDKQEAILLEAQFRDGIQGNQLLNDAVRNAAREARKRGVEVTFNDQGGMNQLDPEEIAAIHESITQALDSTASGRLTVTAPSSEKYAVSIIATRPDASGPDLWLRLP